MPDLKDLTEREVKLYSIMQAWIKEHGYGDLCLLVKCHDGKAVGIEEVKDLTKRQVRV